MYNCTSNSIENRLSDEVPIAFNEKLEGHIVVMNSSNEAVSVYQEAARKLLGNIALEILPTDTKNHAYGSATLLVEAMDALCPSYDNTANQRQIAFAAKSMYRERDTQSCIMLTYGTQEAINTFWKMTEPVEQKQIDQAIERSGGFSNWVNSTL